MEAADAYAMDLERHPTPVGAEAFDDILAADVMHSKTDHLHAIQRASRQIACRMGQKTRPRGPA